MWHRRPFVENYKKYENHPSIRLIENSFETFSILIFYYVSESKKNGELE